MSRVESYFKLHETFPRHPKTIRVYQDDVMLACYVRVGVAMIRHFADRTSDQMVVGGRELSEIAGTERTGGAVQRLKKLAGLSPVEFLDPRCSQDAAKVRSGCAPVVAKVSIRCKRVWVLGLPNFAHKQGFGPRVEKERSPSVSVSVSEAIKKEPVGSAGIAQTWMQAQEAALSYGVKWGKLTDVRRSLVSQRLSEHREMGFDLIAKAIHGYVTLRKSDDFDWKSYLKPKTLLRPSNFDEYLDAYRPPQGFVETTQPSEDFQKKFRAAMQAKPRRRRK